MMFKELNKQMQDCQDGKLGKLAEECAKEIFKNMTASSQEEVNVKSALLKEAFLNRFELYYATQFLDFSEKVYIQDLQEPSSIGNSGATNKHQKMNVKEIQNRLYNELDKYFTTVQQRAITWHEDGQFEDVYVWNGTFEDEPFQLQLNLSSGEIKKVSQQRHSI